MRIKILAVAVATAFLGVGVFVFHARSEQDDFKHVKETWGIKNVLTGLDEMMKARLVDCRPRITNQAKNEYKYKGKVIRITHWYLPQSSYVNEKPVPCVVGIRRSNCDPVLLAVRGDDAVSISMCATIGAAATSSTKNVISVEYQGDTDTIKRVDAGFETEGY